MGLFSHADPVAVGTTLGSGCRTARWDRYNPVALDDWGGVEGIVGEGGWWVECDPPHKYYKTRALDACAIRNREHMNRIYMGKVQMKSARPAGVRFTMCLMTMAGLLGCNNQPALMPPEGDPPLAPDQMDEARREAAISAAQEQFAALMGTEPALAREQLAEFLRTRPEFEAVGIHGREVFARFVDGVMIIFVNNRERTPAAAMRVRSAMRDKFANNLPDSEDFYAANGLGSCFNPATGFVSTELGANGYTPQSLAGASTVEDLKSVSQAGLFYIDAHGGAGELSDGTPRYSIWTDTQATRELQTRYWSDLIDGSLVLMCASHDLLPPIPPAVIPTMCSMPVHYAFTARFVRKHMTFGANSFAFINACQSQSTDAQDLRQAFFDKGLSVYAGWTELVPDDTAGNAAVFLIDRLLGGNDPNAQALPEMPPQRPFDYNAILLDMRKRAPRLDQGTNMDGTLTFLTFTQNAGDNGGDFGLLAPTISGVDPVDEINGRLTLKGAFGENRGRVVVSEVAAVGGRLAGGTLNIRTWSPMQIECDLPLMGAGSRGHVQVQVGNRHSNIVQLTEWRISFHYRSTTAAAAPCGGSWMRSMDVTLHFRACVNALRSQAHQDTSDQLITKMLRSAHDSTATADGFGTINCPGIPMVTGPTTDVLTRTGPEGLVLLDVAPVAPPSFITFNRIDVQGPRREILVRIIGVTQNLTRTLTDDFGMHESGAGVTFDSGDFGPSRTMSNVVALPLDANYNVTADSRNSVREDNATMSWDAAAAAFPPDPAGEQ